MMIGIKDGWSGLLSGSFIPLNLDSISGILPKGGSILEHLEQIPSKQKTDHKQF